MTFHSSAAALAGLAFLLVSCAKPGEEPAHRETTLEQRIARLEAAVATSPGQKDATTPRSATSPGAAGTPHPGTVATPAGATPAGATPAGGNPATLAGANPALQGAAAGAAGGAPDSPPASLEDRIDALEKQMARTLKTVRIPLEVNKSGNEVCAEAGHACLTLLDDAGSARYDIHDKFCGHMVADCNARVTRRPHCSGSNDYLLAPVKFYRSPGTKADCDNFETETCESSPSDLVAICLE